MYPSDDQLVQTLQTCFRTDLPYTRLGHSTLVAVNPMKHLTNLNDESAKEYEERSYRDTSLAPNTLLSHPYDHAARVYLLVRRTQQSQSVIFRCVRVFTRTFCRSNLYL